MRLTTCISIITTLLLLFSMVAGCSKDKESGQVTVKQLSKEDIIMGELAQGKLIAVQEKKIAAKGEEDNTLFIKNAYDKSQTFKIEICQDCKFSETEILIPPNQVKKVDFTVGAVPGEKVVVVRDDNNNYYAKDTFFVE